MKLTNIKKSGELIVFLFVVVGGFFLCVNLFHCGFMFTCLSNNYSKHLNFKALKCSHGKITNLD